mgnify:CR=1 FL=1
MDKEIVKEFQVGPGCHLDVSNVRGSTRVEGWDKPEVRIQAKKHGDDEMTEIEIGQEGNEVWARTRVKRSEWLSWLGMKMPAEVDYVIQVPYQSRVSTSMVSGETTVEGVHGGLKLHTVSGDAHLEDVEGEISLETVSGDIKGGEIKGSARLHTVSGDIVLNASHLTSLKGNTVSGDIRTETDLGSEGEYKVDSVSGDWKLAVPAATRCTATMSTVSGDLQASLSHDIMERRRSNKRYAINGGGVPVVFHSVSGDLKVFAREGEPEVAGQAAPAAQETVPAGTTESGPKTEAPAPSEPKHATTRMQILKAIEAGEMTVEEGIAHLQELASEE